MIEYTILTSIFIDQFIEYVNKAIIIVELLEIADGVQRMAADSVERLHRIYKSFLLMIDYGG